MTYVDHKLSFKEIMDEELAKKLQRDYEEEIACLVEPSQEEQDFLLALKLSQESAPPEFEDVPKMTSDESDQLTEDYLLAIQLQEELNQEQRDYHHLLQQRNAGSNINVVTQYGNLFNDDEPNYVQREEDDEDEDDYEQYDEEYTYGISAKNWNKSANGRVNANEFSKSTLNHQKQDIVTKHNPDICGSRNAGILETQISIDCGNMVGENVTLSNPVFNELNQHAVKQESRRIRKHGKEDRETCESVMDSQTRLLLYKLLNSNLIKDVSGIISSGKEANVYRAASCDDNNIFYAIKIYKTTLNEFKNREDYIKDDYRFRYKFNKQSSRKFIKVWAEKEYENLKRLRRYNIRCPEVVHLRKNILVMNLIGTSDIVAPQLRNVTGLSIEKLQDLYLQCIRMMRVMFQQAKLVHGDLSEYNILYFKGKIWFIDVAQAVEHEHPNALYFLRRDCDNISKYFNRCKLHNLMTTRELFNYITDINIDESNEEEYLEEVLERCANRTELSIEEQQEELVFMSSHIPRHLDDIPDPFAETSDVFHQSLTGLSDDLSGISEKPVGVVTISNTKNEPIEEEIEIKKEWVERPSKQEQKLLRKQAKKQMKANKTEPDVTNQTEV
mmetsp:Transcript_4393/g.7225  ORF Transcript_4393/g.7225 Transcript_4393/m.7225 type:complete len:613 (+) Transcript_4393:35-1873(+)